MTRKSTLLKLIFVLIICFMQVKLFAQADFGLRTPITLHLTTDFGADSTGVKDASYALLKAAKYIENEWYK
jgi:hypothetical protein